MNGSLVSILLAVCEPSLCVLTLICILRRKTGLNYKYLCMLLVCHILSTVALIPLLLFGGHGIERHFAYGAYFWIYWSDFTVETILSALTIYSIFDAAMAPLEGIRKLGILVFRWAVCMSIAVIAGSVLLPHFNQIAFVGNVITELQRTESILTLCLLLFVCFAIRPLGLSYKSRIFGVCLGLGILAMTKLLAFGWMAYSKQLYSWAGVVDSVATCAVLLIWTGYFALPEAKRRIVVLPTTSPFLRWNQISQALGDSPGFVAIGGVPPELFAPAELEVMRRASLKMASQPASSLVQSQIA